jgi:hypothetical protein
MKASFVSATLMVAVALAAAPLGPASAADLDGDAYAPIDEPGYDGGYEDDYGEAPPHGYAPGGHADRPGSIKDGYPVPVPHGAGRAAAPADRYEAPPPRYTGPRRAGPRYACLETWQIRRQLRREGWRHIQPMGGNGGIVHIRATRVDSSSIFRLRVERCTGQVLAAKPQYLRSFAYRERPWRY